MTPRPRKDMADKAVKKSITVEPDTLEEIEKFIGPAKVFRNFSHAVEVSLREKAQRLKKKR